MVADGKAADAGPPEDDVPRRRCRSGPVVVVYIVVFAVVVLGLVLAYRSIGSSAGRAPAPLGVAALTKTLDQVIALLDGDVPPTESAAHQARRLAAGVSLAVAQAAVSPNPDGASASALIGAAAEDCGWAARMAESSGYADNPGLRAAAAALLDHARRCLEEVRPAEPPPPRS